MVVAIVYAVDVSKPSAPACPLPIADPTLGEANHPATIGIDAVAEVEVFYLYLTLASHNGSNDVLMLADGGKGRTFGRGNMFSPTLQKMPDNADKLT